MDEEAAYGDRSLIWPLRGRVRVGSGCRAAASRGGGGGETCSVEEKNPRCVACCQQLPPIAGRPPPPPLPGLLAIGEGEREGGEVTGER